MDPQTAGLKKVIYVFGSSTSGKHSKGAALQAKEQFGAINGKGWGLQGSSFAIPTKDTQLNPLPLKSIKVFVEQFLDYANSHPEMDFEVTRIGCGLAEYTDEQIAPMFKEAPPNCMLSGNWLLINNPHNRGISCGG